MWTPTLPLYKYREIVLKGDTTSVELKRWATMGPIFKKYGIYIMRQYPIEYLRNFAMPNFVKYYAPPSEFLEFYNGGNVEVSPIASSWFNYKSNKVSTRVKDIRAHSLDIYTVLTGTMNVIFIASLICILSLKEICKNDKKTLLIIVVIWVLNAGFTILSSPAAIRLQAFPIIMETVFAISLVDWLFQALVALKNKKVVEPYASNIVSPVA
jgi:hypothetical protein